MMCCLNSHRHLAVTTAATIIIITFPQYRNTSEKYCRVKREKNQHDATNVIFIIQLLSLHVSDIIMPIIEQDRVLLHVVFCTGCAGCGCVELGRMLR